jgi:CheY-like chemotaxis protein
MTELVASTSGPRVQVDLNIEADLPAAVADANQLEMAILNLAVNARDAMENGGTLTIAAQRAKSGAESPATLASGEYVRLSVTDTGVGMDEDTLKRAVEPFFSTKGIGKGTGLGLSMAHGLTAQLGGALSIRSRPGIGTTVDLWLPISDQGAAQAHDRSVGENERQATGTALIVDDEELVRASTAEMLADLGYAVVEANSAEEALRLLENGLQCDLLVTDHLMPGMSGTELARQVRSQLGAPVLVISGYAEVDGIAPDLPRLTKPFRRDELAECLSRMPSTATKNPTWWKAGLARS